MNKKVTILSTLFFVMLMFMLCPDTSQSAGHSSQPVSPVSSHPRLYFTPTQLADFKEKIAGNERIKRAWMNLLKQADSLVHEELVSPEYAESGSGQHGNYGRPSGQISAMGATLGLAYQMTGEKKYAEKLRQALLHYAQLKRWAGDARRDPPWNSELNTARFCYGYGVGYDSIHDYLSASDRKEIVNALVQKGILPTLNDWILPEKRIHALDSMGHNWWSVCVAMAGVASLAILDEELRAHNWVERIREAFPEWFLYQGNILQNKSPNFDEKGAFYESVLYANYALSEYLLFHLAHTNACPDTPLPEIPLLKTAGDFFIHTAYPTSDSLLSVNFGDSNLFGTGSKTVSLLLANGFASPEYHWYLTREGWGLTDPVGLVYHRVQPQEEPPASLPETMIYSDIGWVMMRSSWADNATLLAIKSGFTWNHAHPDAGSFILFHGGKPLIIDSGNCSYSRPEYTRYYRHSKAHNVILTDGEAQNPEDIAQGDRGVVHPGEVHHLMDLSGIRYVLADATGPTSWKFSRNYRHFLWIDDVILMIDDVRTHEPGQLEWLLHYEGDAREEDSQVLLSNGAESRAVVQRLYPKEMNLVRKQGYTDHDPDTEVEYLAFVPPQESREMKFITAILPLHEGEDAADIHLELLEEEEALGVRIIHQEEITDVFFNLRADGRRMHQNSNKIINGWDTDSCIFGLTYPKESIGELDAVAIKRCVVICGSYLRKGEDVLLNSLSKVYSVFSAEENQLNVILQGQPLMNCEFHTRNKPSIVKVNGRIVDAEWDTDQETVKVQIQQEK
ncbi:MAG: heparinase II/III domain-containing protein [bacterium]|jgi:hypothetical protein